MSILQGKEEFKKFMEEREEKKFIEPTETCKISDEKLIKEIKKKLGVEEVGEVNNGFSKEVKEKIKQILEIEGTNPFQVCRVTGITMGRMRSILK